MENGERRIPTIQNAHAFFAWINETALPELQRLARENRFHERNDLATIQSEDGAFVCQATPKGSGGEYLYIGCVRCPNDGCSHIGRL